MGLRICRVSPCTAWHQKSLGEPDRAPYLFHGLFCYCLCPLVALCERGLNNRGLFNEKRASFPDRLQFFQDFRNDGFFALYATDARALASAYNPLPSFARKKQ